MSERKTPRFDTFDASIAEAFIAVSRKAGGLPKYLGAEITEITPGRLVARMEIRPELVTPMGAIHGGVIAGFVDHALGCVLYPLMKRGAWAATTEFKLNYLAPVKEGTLVAESTVLQLGRRSAVVRVDVTNDGRLAAAAQGTLLIAEPPAKSERS